jgi:sulfite exporter TauE/SafE
LKKKAPNRGTGETNPIGEEEEGTMPRSLRIVLGGVLLVLGVAGLALPLLQGVLFIVLGVVLLARDIPLFARISAWLRSRFPGISRAAEDTRRRITEWWHK